MQIHQTNDSDIENLKPIALTTDKFVGNFRNELIRKIILTRYYFYNVWCKQRYFFYPVSRKRHTKKYERPPKQKPTHKPFFSQPNTSHTHTTKQ